MKQNNPNSEQMIALPWNQKIAIEITTEYGLGLKEEKTTTKSLKIHFRKNKI